jgi:hypothetical protein
MITENDSSDDMSLVIDTTREGPIGARECTRKKIGGLIE